jgi:DNA polymerase elongation subunit (family B)
MFARKRGFFLNERPDEVRAPTYRLREREKILKMTREEQRQRQKSQDGDGEEDEEKARYQGATVLDPDIGFYPMVITLDFASLYPSILREKNLCYSSIVLDSKYLDLPGWCYEKQNIAGKMVCFQQSVQGILPVLSWPYLGRTLSEKWPKP